MGGTVGAWRGLGQTAGKSLLGQGLWRAVPLDTAPAVHVCLVGGSIYPWSPGVVDSCGQGAEVSALVRRVRAKLGTEPERSLARSRRQAPLESRLVARVPSGEGSEPSRAA